MKLVQITDSIVLYNINTVQKFDIVKNDLMRTLKINEDHKVMNDMPINEYNGILRKNIESGYEKFRLLVALDIYTKRVVGYTAVFIVIDDNQQNGCLIYGAYFAPKLLRLIFPYIVSYLDQFASQFNCIDMLFSTSRSAKAYDKLFHQKPNNPLLDFKPTHTIFRRKIPSNVSYIRKAI